MLGQVDEGTEDSRDGMSERRKVMGSKVFFQPKEI